MPDIPLVMPNGERTPPRRQHLALYVAGFALVQVSVLLIALRLAAAPWFLSHDHYPGMRQTGYGLRLNHADCDIVIYGDSSALTGLHPDTIEQITGLKTCNISEGATIQGVVGSNWPLDMYLRNNKRPSFMLTMYTPSMFRPYRAPLDEYQPEGMLYAFQYDRDYELYRGMLHKPRWLMEFAIWSGHALLEDMQSRFTAAGRARAAVDTRAQREAQLGVWPYPLPPEDHCVRTERHYDPATIARHEESVAEMRSKYTVGGTQMLINIAPVPVCDTLARTYAVQSQGLHDNAFETRPISDFNEGDVHFTPAGGTRLSVGAANQILVLERSAGGAEVGQPGAGPGR